MLGNSPNGTVSHCDVSGGLYNGLVYGGVDDEGAYELFFILNGEGIGRCNGASFPLSAGDVAIFPPGSVHGIDNLDGRLYCLEFMVPNERFAEMVRSGTEDSLDEDDLCALVARGCGGVE